MKVYKEEQNFRQWWLVLIAITTITGIFLIVFEKTAGFTKLNGHWLELSAFLISLLTFALLFTASLHTKIDRIGITTWWEPFNFPKKEFTWKEIKKCHVRKYHAFSEYGGWGIRGAPKAKAYTTKGNKGLQILFYHRKPFLIGTGQPGVVEKTILTYVKKQR